LKVKYDTIGKFYNTTRRADPFIVERLFYFLKPNKGSKYLDIGCGTGNYTVALNQKGIALFGVDPSTEMLKNAKAKPSNIKWKVGNAENIPLENEAVDGVLATLTIHHWKDLNKAFTELNRVLKPSGNVVIFTSTPEQMKGYWLKHYFPKMLEDSSKQMPAIDVIKKAMKTGGFEIIETEKYFVREDLEDMFLFSGKHDPKLYLNSQNRQGISSFSNLANAEEVEKGLHKLKIDIASGKINKVIEKYANDYGDYLFMIGRKSSIP
jgi:SAM-dependent methyltransferase